MAIRLILAALLFMGLAFRTFSQWPGYFYAFELKDVQGIIIDSSNHDYRMSTIVCDGCKNDIILGIRMCEDNKTWRYYAGGNYTHLNNSNFLKIEKLRSNEIVETMIIEFPASLSGGKEKYYRNLYAGAVIFRNGKHKVILPGTDDEWDQLKQLKICPDDINSNYSFDDISKFQKQ